jgi:hypothetical protein
VEGREGGFTRFHEEVRGSEARPSRGWDVCFKQVIPIRPLYRKLLLTEIQPCLIIMCAKVLKITVGGKSFDDA